jgi:2-oxoglutarate ferredoxin oxidoreductase subunit alpha
MSADSNGRARFLQGNEACAEGAIAAGCRFFAGYPITPSTEIAELMSELLPRIGGRFIQMEDEIASMAAVIGASLGGLKSMTATSGPGFSLKQENLGFAALAEIPCVVVNAQRAGPSTGLPTSPAQGDVMQARWGTHGDHPAIAYCPSTVAEAFELTVLAFNTSEELRTPVIVLLDEVVSHMREKVELGSPEDRVIVDRRGPTVPPAEYLPYGPPPGTAAADADAYVPAMAAFGSGYRYHVTGLTHGKHGLPIGPGPEAEFLVRRICEKVERARPRLSLNRTESIDDAEYVVVSYGGAARSALRAVRQAREMGVAAGLFRPLTIWPFPDAEIAALAARCKGVLVVEMNLGQVVLEVQRAAGGRCPVRLFGRVNGELLRPAEILAALLDLVGAGRRGEDGGTADD